VQEILGSANQKLSLSALLEWWPEEENRPTLRTLSRWMNRATQQGAIRRTGAGTRGDPFVYWLAEREPMLFPGHGAGHDEIEAWKERCTAAVCARFRETGMLG
jgi:hypothetical protein